VVRLFRCGALAAKSRMLAAAAVAVLAQAAWLGPLVGPARAAVTVDLDQWASLSKAWQNGNLNGNNASYPEGGVVPFRLALEGLAVGNHTIRISYDFTAGGHKAYDFLATWNATNAAGKICVPSGGAISSMCPALPPVSSSPLPADPFTVDGLSVHGAETYAGMPRRLSIWGGSILAISSPVHTGSASGNSEVELVVTFKATGPAVLFAWGGHLAQSSYWNSSIGGAADGASLVSGAPWHVRTLGLDGSGSKNQDRSIQPSAISGELPPGGQTPSGSNPPIVARPTLPPVLPPGFPPIDSDVTPPSTATSLPSDPGVPPPWVGLIPLFTALLTLVIVPFTPRRR
jgi:hypothetical protein